VSYPSNLVSTLLSYSNSWLYSLILTADASYKMKSKEKGIENDPPLGDGWSHFAPTGPYGDYVEKYGHQIEVSHCHTLWITQY
jgi:hypothetical protein